MKLPPLAQQTAALSACDGARVFGYFLDTGTGKSYLQLAEAEALWLENAIDCLVIVAPAGVHRNWVEREVPRHLSLAHEALYWPQDRTQSWTRAFDRWFATGRHPDQRIGLLVMAFNVEAFSTRGTAELFLVRLLRRFRCLLAVDESSVLKTPSAARTKNLVRLGRLAAYRRILTGTPVTERPLDFYAQFRFLGDNLLGFKNFATFKAFYAEWNKRILPHPKDRTKKIEFQELKHYKNMDVLKERVALHSFTVRKEHCLDLPPKVHELRLVEPTKEQKTIYNAAKKALILELESPTLKMTLAHAFTRLTRLAQIAGGHLKADDAEVPEPIPGKNPKLESLLQFIEELPAGEKVIVWARYVPEMRLLRKALGPGRTVAYWGEISADERNDNIDRFMNDERTRFFVGNAKVGKFGFTLTAASEVVYFSNDYSAEARKQSEDRAHRIGQKRTVTVTDLAVAGTIDELILQSLQEKRDMADYFSAPGKSPREQLLGWLRQ